MVRTDTYKQNSIKKQSKDWLHGDFNAQLSKFCSLELGDNVNNHKSEVVDLRLKTMIM